MDYVTYENLFMIFDVILNVILLVITVYAYKKD